MSGEVEHGLIVPGASAEILSGILWIITACITAGPTAAVFFPDGRIISIGGTDRDPGTFPVEDAFGTGLAGSRTDIPHFVGLPLYAG